ncbi:pyridoxal-phosphate-dependent aminotransferase family protein [Candidatus Latescibacterota bacterium]
MSFEIIKPLLMIPGPMDVSDEVMRRVGHQVFPHYDPLTRFPEFYHQLTEKMKPVFGLEDGSVIIPNGSGTLAVNMAIASLCTPEDEVLVIDNGLFGEYAEKNLKALGIPYTLVKGEWGRAIDSDLVRAAMRKKRHPFIYMTHNESSTAVVNPITPIGTIAREYDALLIADAVSSVGGIAIDMGENGADVVAGASQKCLEIPPGLAPVAVGERAWKYMESMKNRRVPYILDFQVWKRAYIDQFENHPQPVTGATTLLYALDWMIDEILREGIEHRKERFNTAGMRLKQGLEPLGFTMTADPADASPVVTDFITPGRIDRDILRKYYFEYHNTMVGHGFGTVDEKTGKNISFRIAHFGMAASDERIDHMIGISKQFVEFNKTF